MPDQVFEVVKATMDPLLHSDVAIDTRRDDVPGWDSLRHVEVVFALEDHFNIEFDADEIPKIDSVRAIVDLIQAKQ